MRLCQLSGRASIRLLIHSVFRMKLNCFLIPIFLFLSPQIFSAERVLVFANNTVEPVTLTVEIDRKGKSMVRELKTLEPSSHLYKTYTEQQLLKKPVFRFIDQRGNRLSTLIPTEETMQVLFALKPRESDLESFNQLAEQIKTERMVVAQKAAEEEQAQAIRTELARQQYITGAFISKARRGIFLQESDNSGDSRAVWSFWPMQDMANRQIELIELSRTSDGVELEVVTPDHKFAFYYLQKKQLLSLRQDAEFWDEAEVSPGFWNEYQMLFDQIQDAVETKAAETTRRKAEEQAETQANAEKSKRLSMPLPFEAGRAFRTGSGSLFVNKIGEIWEFWMPDDFDRVIELRETARNAMGIWLENPEEKVWLRLKEFHYDFKNHPDARYQEVNSDDVVGDWEWTSYSDLLNERNRAETEFKLAQQEEQRKYRGSTQEIMDRLWEEPQFVQWLNNKDQTGVERTKTPLVSSQYNEFMPIRFIEQGYHILAMDPGRPSNNGLWGLNPDFEVVRDHSKKERVLLFDLDPLTQPHYQNSNLDATFAMGLSATPRNKFQNRITKETVSNYKQHTQSQSLNVSVNVGSPVGSLNGGRATEHSESNTQSLEKSFHYHDIRAYYCDLILDKERVHLHPDLIDRVMAHIRGEGESLESRTDIVRFFENFGTHYAVRAMIGAKAWEFREMDQSSVEQAITDSTTTSSEVTVPVKAVTLGVKSEKTDSESTELKQSKSEGSIEIGSFGGSFVGELEEWEFEADDTVSMEPLRVMLKPVWELIRPQYFPVQNESEIKGIRELQLRMQRELAAYIGRKTRQIPDANPFFFEFSIDSLVCTNPADKEVGEDKFPDLTGTLSLATVDSSIAEPTLWDTAKDENRKSFSFESSTAPRTTKDKELLFSPIVYQRLMSPDLVEIEGVTYAKYPETVFVLYYNLYDEDWTGRQRIGTGMELIPVDGWVAHPHFKLREKTIQFSADGAGDFELKFSLRTKGIEFEKQVQSHPDWYSL